MGVLKDLLAFRKWVKKIEPKEKFDSSKVPVAPKYSDMKYWAAHPNIKSKVFFKPEGVGENDLPLDADAFFIHPTSYFGNQNWNYDFKHPQATELIEEAMMVSQASVFNGCCRIFAPRYRQATFHTFIKNTNNGRSAMDLAYSDILKAFQYYLEHENNGRPFFIASHSQGTCHGIRLIEEFVDKHECVNRLVASYNIGFQFPEEKFTSGQFQNIKISESPTDTQCVIAYDTYLETGKPAHFFDKAEIYYPNKKKWIKRAFKKPIGINPVTWTRSNEKINAIANGYLGGIIIKHSDPSKINVKAFGSDEKMGMDSVGIKAPEMEQLTLEIRKDGFLYSSKPKNPLLRRMLLPGGNLHNYDYSLFYMNIRENIMERFKAFQKQ